MAEQQYQERKPGTGVLFQNTGKTKDNQPDHTGELVLQDGTKQRIAMWNRISKNGVAYFSIAVSDPRPQSSGTAAPPPLVEMTDDIPF